MGLIEFNNFSLAFGDKVLFKDANFFVNKFDKMGIVGVNGAGKSTLLKMLTKEVLYDKGELNINPNVKIGYLDQHALIDRDKSVMDYLRESFQSLFDADKKLELTYEKMASASTDEELISLTNQTEKIMQFLQSNDFYSIDGKIRKVADGLGVTDFGLDTKVRTLSGGQRAKVRLAKLLLEKPDVILLDEPTNFLDTSHIEWLTNYIKSTEDTFIVVSHDEKFLADITTCIVDVDEKTVTRYNENFAKFVQDKQMRKEMQQNAYDRQQKKIEQTTKLIDRFRYKATKASMVQSRIKALNKMELVEKPTEHSRPTFLFNYKMLGSKILLETTNLKIGYNGKSLLNKPITLTLEKGEKLAITGFNGIGKSTFLKTIAGIIPAVSGEFKFATNTIIGYYEQDNIFEDDSMTPLQYILSEFPRLTETEARNYLARSGLKSKEVQEPIKSLSGGEQGKIKICKLMLTPCNILILDEPTNHLDHNAIEQLSVAIKKFGGTVLFVSHDKEFVKRNADKILSFEQLLG